MITFNRKQVPIRVFKDGEYAGTIRNTHRHLPCSACGHHTGRMITTGYYLEIKGRLWRDDQLADLGRGGGTGFYAKRLGDVRAKAIEVLS